MAERDGVVFYRSFWEAITNLDDADQLASVKAIIEYGLYGTEPECSGVATAIFMMAKPQIDANNRRYENGTKGGRPRVRTDEETKEADRARNSAKYMNWRNSVYERDGYRCTRCGAEENLHAHHIKNFIDYPELRYEVENGITLCGSCHSKEHGSTDLKPSDNLAVTYLKPKEKEKEKVKDKEKEKDNKTFCPEPENSAPGTSEKIAVSFLLNDGSMYNVTENDVVKYQQLYPGIDCMQELRKIVGWCDSNPKNRKTRNGAKRFVNGWLARAHDKARPSASVAKPNRFHNFDAVGYDYDAIVEELNSNG